MCTNSSVTVGDLSRMLDIANTYNMTASIGTALRDVYFQCPGIKIKSIDWCNDSTPSIIITTGVDAIYNMYYVVTIVPSHDSVTYRAYDSEVR